MRDKKGLPAKKVNRTPREKTTHIRIPISLKKILKEMARGNKVSMVRFISLVINNWIKVNNNEEQGTSTHTI